MASRTLGSLLKASAARYGERPALCQPGERGYLVYSWKEYLRAAQEIAAGLRVLGIRKGDIVGLDSETRAEFYLADLGVMTSGAIAAALYTSYPPADRVRTLRVCGARAVFVEDAKTLVGLRDAGGSWPALSWIVLTGEAEGALTLEDLRRLGRDVIAREPEFPTSLEAEVTAEDHAILYLTSGATGEPKMGLVTHGALVANLEMGPQVLDLRPEDCTLAFLPSAHITQRVVIELLPLVCGVPVWFSESLLKMPQELERIQPTFFVAPPRLWERVHTTIRTEIGKRPAAVRKLVEASLNLGLEAARRRQRGAQLPAWRRALLKAADRLFFQRMRARFGGRLRVCGSGSAPLGKELAEFYLAIGLPLVEGYGLTEGGVVAMNPLQRPRPGSIGKPLPGVEVRLASDGELLLRSPTLFSGYYKDPEATACVLRDGWLYTGDLAEIDSEGYVYITGRKKELIVSSTGKKVYPSRIEALFHLEPIVSHVLPVGDGRPHLAALFTINTAVAETLRGMESWRGRAAADIALAPPVIREVQKAVERANRNLAPFEQIRKFRILDRDFSIDAGELTATLKVRRSRALEHFHEVVAELYQ